jgi:hypothetical protein
LCISLRYILSTKIALQHVRLSKALYEGREMSITLIVSKIFDEDFNEIGEEIIEEEWEDFVESQDYLRFRTEPYIAQNPSTGETIEITAPEGTTEVLIENEWHSFLEYSNGELRMQYSQDLDDPVNPMRKAVAGVAGYFAALIRHDAGDETLKW